ncbi:contactin-2-like [Diadema antillarum]|uniref:contactin-2-like n=1 Tax=Diadema antillarum TaxID=105358 RepID=UPI003A8A6315
MLETLDAPKKARNLTCASSNVDDYHCTWVPVETGIETAHTFWYWKYQGSGDFTWEECPNEDPEPNKCTLTKGNDHSGSEQRVKVKSVNLLGEVETDTVYFNPDMEAIPNEPTNLRLSAEGPTSLRAEWELPSDWYQYNGGWIEFRVRYRAASQESNWSNAQESNWSNAPCSPGIRLMCRISGLNPHTMYEVQVSARLRYTVTAIWGDCTLFLHFFPAFLEPSGKVQNLAMKQQFNSSEDNLYLRNVLISWKPVKEAEQRGVILGYNVRVPQPDGCRDNRTRFDTVNVTQVYIEGLERFCEYVVEVQAYNSQGRGPLESMVLGDMTSTPERPTGVAAKTLSHQSILVSWDEPTVVQGYITAYTVYWMKATDQDLMENSREVSPNEHSVVIDKLKGYVLYYFYVSVTNSKGESSRSSQVRNKTAEWEM